MGSLGIKIQNALPIRDNVLLVQYAEARGLDSVWVSEYRTEPFVAMALYAAATERVDVGSAITQLYTRTAPVIAMSAAALAEIAPGRIILGVGTSTGVIIGQWHGTERAKPLAAAEEYIDAVRTILRGDKVQLDGRVVGVDGFQLDHPVAGAERFPIYAAALGEKMLTIAGKTADGVLINAAPFPHLPVMRAKVDAASVAAGRPAGSVKLAGDIRVGIGTGTRARTFREQQRKAMAYYGKMPPYNRFFAEAGFERQADEMREAWAAKDRDRAFAAFDDEMLDQIVVIGDEDTVQQRLTEIAAGGLDTVIIYPLWDDESPAVATQRIIEVAAETTG